MMLSRSSQVAVAAASALAEVHGTERPALTAQQIAARRNIPRPYVAKVLTVMARARLVRGTRGPGGGFVLQRHPSRITLKEIAACFDGGARVACPLGRTRCRRERPCPLHDPIQRVHQAAMAFLDETTLGGFVAEPEARRGDPPSPRGGRCRRRGA
jgi:Rrf2 family transcriptional regulator, iron-sulfur cluster assembly transcription factor